MDQKAIDKILAKGKQHALERAVDARLQAARDEIANVTRYYPQKGGDKLRSLRETVDNLLSEAIILEDLRVRAAAEEGRR